MDFEPLSVGAGNKFPFGIMAWLGATLSNFEGGGALPVITIPMPGNIEDWELDATPFADPMMAVIRPVILIISGLGMMWLFAASALGFGRGGGD